MPAIGDLIARSQAVISHRPNTRLSPQNFLHITRENPRTAQSPLATLPSIPTTTTTPTPPTTEAQTALNDILTNRCPTREKSRQAREALLEKTSHLRFGPALDPEERQRQYAQRAVPAYEYSVIFEGVERVPSFSQIVAKTMPPLKNLYAEATKRVDLKYAFEQYDNSHGFDRHQFKLSPNDCRLLEFEHLRDILRRFGKNPLPRTMVTAVQSVEMIMSQVDKPVVGIPPYTIPSIAKDHSADDQLITLVRSVETRKSTILQLLREHWGIDYSGPYLKETGFWDVVRHVISESRDHVCDEVAQLADAPNKTLINRHRAAIIAAHRRRMT